MKTYILLLLGIVLLFSSCEEQDEFSICDDNPIENVNWIKELVDEQNLIDCSDCSLEIIQYNYKDNTVFSVDNCVGCSDALITVYDCDKNTVCEFGGVAGLDTCPDFYTEAVEQAIVYSTRVTETKISNIIFQNLFGLCGGYCNHTIEITDGKLTYTSKDWQGESEPISCEFSLSTEEWNNIQNDLDTEEFLTLEEVYGCPDCADGGASVIEIELATGETKKVTFEYNNPPNIIAEYAEMLQNLLDNTNNCEAINEEQSCDKTVIVNNEVYDELYASEITNFEIIGNCLAVTHLIPACMKENYTDGVNLIDSGVIAESLPVQRSLKFSIEPYIISALCAVTEVETSFDISDLATWDEPEVLLNIEGYDEKVLFTRQPQCGDPNVTCLPTTKEQELKELTNMLNELKTVSSIVKCETTEDISLALIYRNSFGMSPLYLPYSNSINVEKFLNKVEIYRQAEDTFNKKWDVIYTNEELGEPNLECENGAPVLVN